MFDLVAIICAQLDKIVPEKSRVRILACLSFVGLGVWMYVSVHTFATRHDVTGAVMPLTDAMAADRKVANARWVDQLNTEIIQAAGRCRETHDDDARELYEKELGGLLERYQTVSGHQYPQINAVDCH